MLVDIDAFSSDAEKLSAILKCADVEQHQHQLSIDYFRFRKYSLLIPTIILSFIIAVVGFVAASAIMKDHMKMHDATMQDFLTLVVASFGFLVLVFTILGNGLDYNSKIAFHSAAAEDLGALCDKVRLYRMDRAMDEHAKDENDELKDLFDENEEGNDDASTESDETEPTRSHENQIIPHAGLTVARKEMRRKMKATKQMKKRQEKLTKTLVKQKVRQAREEQELSKDVITFYGYHTELHQISRGCRSDVPPQISRFFQVMENRVELMSLSRLGVEEESRMRKNQIVRLCASEIYNEISNFALWPVTTPNVDRTIEDALKHVGQLLNMSYRGQRRCKLIPCCPIPLCCKKKTTNNVFAIINEGIDQRELDMMQAERVEMVKMENDRRARRNAGPEEVVEMRDTLPRAGGGGRSRSSHPEYYASADHSHRSKDPDGQTYNDMATEDSFSFKAGGSASRGRGYASNHYAPQGGQSGGMYPQDDDYLTLENERGSVLTEETGTFAGSYRTYDDEEGTEEEMDEEEGKRAEKKSKKKKKKKSKKKKKKKEKAKKKEKEEEEYDEDDYSEEYSDGFTEGEYSEYSEQE